MQLNVAREGVAVLLELIVCASRLPMPRSVRALPTWVPMLVYPLNICPGVRHGPQLRPHGAHAATWFATSPELVRSYFCQKIICLWFWAGPRKPEFLDAETSPHYFFLSSDYLNRRRSASFPPCCSSARMQRDDAMRLLLCADNQQQDRA